ncbi:hypothetical protein H9660_15110 [Clostridium sp. Sa3CUN1]|uniref:Uncharacterized protein n=1 Tax=Clostridium gallinarum TaxID=2762246 RepID=A0ABR8Q7R1_9CLOT|nr:hypothetical protein [Clostridium gallinarum]MBD7916472.1 hypothetical protein [Clostridium gallinarum]
MNSDKKYIWILIVLFSCIPLINISNIIIVATLLIVSIMNYNVKLICQESPKINFGIIIFKNIIIFIFYYFITLMQTFLSYLGLISKLSEFSNVDVVDVGFSLVDPKIILMSIPIIISSFLCVKNGVLKKKIFIFLNVINILIFIFIVK